MNKSAYFISFLLISLFLIQIGEAQEKKIDGSTATTKSKKEVSDSLEMLMRQHRNKEIISISESDILKGEANDVLELLEPYEGDSSAVVRRRAYAFASQVGKSHKDPKIRKKVTAQLVKGLGDSDSLVWQSTGKNLLHFSAEDFTDATKASIKQYFNKRDPERLNYIIRVIGIAQMKDEMEKLGELLIDESMYKQMWWGTATDGWAARLARARMGSKADITRAIEHIESIPDKDTRVIVLLKHIAYIRQPEAIEILRKYLDSDEATLKHSIDVRQMAYAQIGIDLLADSIDNFPITKREAGLYSQSDIELARKWMSDKSNWTNSIRR